MAAELLAIVEAFAAGGIRALPYKGPALAESVYGNVAMRQFGDLDILVPRDQVKAAKACLRARGYAPEYPLAGAVEAAFLRSPAQYHLVMRHAARGVMVELHWKTDPEFPVERGDEAWWAGLDWVFARAAALRCTRRLAVGLVLAHRLLDAPVPEAHRRRAEMLPGVHGLCGPIERACLESRGGETGAFASLRANLALYDTPRQRLTACVNHVWSPSLVEWSRWPLPRPLFFLYPPLRLARLAWKHTADHGRGSPAVSETPAAATPRTPPPPRRSTG
jgi:hypothetical protein